MSLTGSQFRILQDALLAAFDSERLRQMLRLQLDVDLDAVTSPRDNTTTRVFDLIAWADQQGRVLELVQSALLEAPGNAALRDAAALWGQMETEAGPPPYQGLAYFGEGDAGRFFGREALAGQLVAHLKNHRFLAVIGASGSGKSSLVRAGVVPELRKGAAIPGSERWHVAVLTPTPRPLETLALELKLPDDAEDGIARFEAMLRGNNKALHLRARLLLKALDKPRLLLVADQFEELFTLCKDKAERKAFIDNLLAAAEPDGVTSVVLTLRADFYAHCAEHDELRAALEVGQRYIGAMTLAELRRAIEGPAQQGGWQLEPGLADLIMADVEEEPGALPLLSHALLATWERRDRRTLTFAGYQAAGGVRGAIAKTADAVFTALSNEEQAVARSIFLRLTEPGEGVQDTRRRAPLFELASLPTVELVLQKLEDARLITVDSPGGSPTYVDVTHEALIREWPALRSWLDEDREGLRTHRKLTEASQEWTRQERDPDLLYRGVRLEAAKTWAEAHAGELNENERTFLAASVERVETERREREAARQRALEQERALTAQALALAGEAEARRQAETQRAEEQAKAARHLRRRNQWLGAALVAALAAVVLALFFFARAEQNARDARIAAERENLQRIQAEEARALANANAQAAEEEKLNAQRQTRRARAGELAVYAQNALANFPNDESLALLLAISSVETTWQADRFVTGNADAALRSAIASAPPYRMSLPRDRHNGPILSAIYSPDGKYVVTASEDQTARIWDATTGEELRQLTGHTDAVYFAAYSPDGKHIVTTSQDQTARIWDAATGEQLHQLTGHGGVIHWVAYSPDGKYIVTAGGDSTARIWDAASGEQLRRLTGHDGNVLSAAFSPDGKHIVTASWDNTARIWDAATAEQLYQLTGHTGFVLSAAYSPDGKAIVTASEDRTARIWDAATREEPHQLIGHNAIVRSATYSPDGKHIVTRGDDNVRIWDAATGKELQQLTGHSGEVRSAAYSPDGTHIVTRGNDNVRIWDAATGKELQQLTEHTRLAFSAAYSPDGEYIVTTSWDDTASIWEAASGEELHQLIGHTDMVQSAAYSADSKQIVTASFDGTVRIWDAATGEELHRLAGHTGNIYSAKYSPNGKYIVTTSDEPGARIWDAATGEQLHQLTGHDGSVYGVAYSPDGKHIVTTGGDDTARIWDAATGEELRRLIVHDGNVYSATYSPNGKHIVTTGSDDSVRIWDAATGEELRQLTGYTFAVQSATYSPDSKHIVTTGADEIARIWLADIADLLDQARSLVQRDPPLLTPEERQRYGLD